MMNDTEEHSQYLHTNSRKFAFCVPNACSCMLMCVSLTCANRKRLLFELPGASVITAVLPAMVDGDSTDATIAISVTSAEKTKRMSHWFAAQPRVNTTRGPHIVVARSCGGVGRCVCG
jgi:hypothetical protein